MRRTRELEKLVQANVKKVEWTLEDPTWRPTRDYLEKMLTAYKAHTAELLGMLGAIAEERERCAKIAETFTNAGPDDICEVQAGWLQREIAKAIRAELR